MQTAQSLFAATGGTTILMQLRAFGGAAVTLLAGLFYFGFPDVSVRYSLWFLSISDEPLRSQRAAFFHKSYRVIGGALLVIAAALFIYGLLL